MKEIDYLLNYLATYPNATIRYRASDMIIYIRGNAVYKVLPEARSKAEEYFYLSNALNTKDATNVANNEAIHNRYSTICNVIGSTAEEEVGGLYINYQWGK